MARNYVQAKDYRLAGAGISSTDTSITLTSMSFPNSGVLVSMDDFGEIGFATIEPETNREENVSFTGITQNLNGTATLTGVVRGLKFATPPYGQDITLRRSHSGGTIFRITNSAQFYYNLANKYNEETIEAKWTFPSTPGVNRPVISADTDTVLSTELITKGEVNKLIQATFLPPVVVSTSQGSTGLVAGQITPFAHTIPAGLTSGGSFVVIHTQEDVTVSSITLGAQNFTQVATETRAGSNQRIEIWRLLAPSAVTSNVTVTTSGNALSTAQVITLENVNQTTPVDALSTGADGSGTAVADSITTVTVNSVILIGVGGDTDPTVFTPTAPLAEILVDDAGTLRPTSSSVRSTTTAGVYNLAYTIAPTQDFVTKSIAIRGVASGGSSSSLEVEENGVSVETGVTKINIVAPSGTVTNPSAGEVEINLLGLGGGGSGTKLVIDTTPVTVASSSAETSILGGTVQIPANTLGTNDAIRFNIIVDNFQLDNSDVYVKLKYGTTTIGQVLVLSDTLAATKGIISGYIIADGATNAQKGFLNVSTTNQDVEASGTPNINISKFLGSVYGTATEDSTTNLNLDVTIEFSSATATNTITTEAVVVEKITDAGSGSDIEIFTADGTWNKPAGAKKVLVELFGAGGGGGGGGFANTTNAAGGGGGGGGGSYNARWFDASELPSSVAVTVGVGGTGGAGTSTPPSGAGGTAGTGSSFGTLANAYGGGGGNGGGFPLGGPGGAGGTVAIINPENEGGDGGAGNNSIGTGTPGSGSVLGSGGGGGGAGCGSAASSGGSAGGKTNSVTTGGGAAGGAAGANGSNGTTIGEGGGSGGSQHNGVAGNGGNGGVGAGGGGGGASNEGGGSGGPSGDGGDGGRGEVRVTTFF